MMLKYALLFMFVPLLGCTAVLVGGAGVGGYYAGTDERSLGQITEDAAITASINAAFLRDDIVETLAVDVDTHRNVVTLYGAIKSRKQSVRAVQLAQSVKGVKRVISKLKLLSQ